jgi:hypothetical protein
MTIAMLAHGARESLARGLEALQAEDVPPALFDVAGPVARAMGALVELERATPALAPARVEPALEALREGLRLLQLPEHVDHPAAARGMAAVAETLGAVVELARHLETAPAVTQPPAPSRRNVVIEPHLRAFAAPLDAHGASNFYAGASGGDVLTAGGLFVASHDIPAVGESVLLKISMPGGYQFMVRGVVAWTRGLSGRAGTSEPLPDPVGTPGFGARLSEVGDDAIELIRRYVKNRTPLFHDE